MTSIEFGRKWSSSGSQMYVPNASCPFARIGRKRRGRLIGPVGRNAAIASRPRNHARFGGIANVASSVSIATTASTSLRSQAST